MPTWNRALATDGLGHLAATPHGLARRVRVDRRAGLCLLIVGLQLHHAYTAATACHPANSAACNAAVANFNGIGNFLSNGVLFLVVPPLIGAFVGAPLLAREFEPYLPLRMDPGLRRWRWTLAKLVSLGVAVAVASAALSVLASCTTDRISPRAISPCPFPRSIPQSRIVRAARLCLCRMDPCRIRNRRPGRRAHSQSRPCHRDHSGCLRSARLCDGGWLRMHYLTPLITEGLNVPGASRIVSQWEAGAVGSSSPDRRPFRSTSSTAPLRPAWARAAGGSGIPSVPGSARLHVLDSYQPAAGSGRSVDRKRLAARAFGPAHRRDRMARPSPRSLKFDTRRAPAPFVQTSRCQQVVGSPAAGRILRIDPGSSASAEFGNLRRGMVCRILSNLGMGDGRKGWSTACRGRPQWKGLLALPLHISPRQA